MTPEQRQALKDRLAGKTKRAPHEGANAVETTRAKTTDVLDPKKSGKSIDYFKVACEEPTLGRARDCFAALMVLLRNVPKNTEGKTILKLWEGDPKMIMDELLRIVREFQPRMNVASLTAIIQKKGPNQVLIHDVFGCGETTEAQAMDGFIRRFRTVMRMPAHQKLTNFPHVTALVEILKLIFKNPTMPLEEAAERVGLPLTKLDPELLRFTEPEKAKGVTPGLTAVVRTRSAVRRVADEPMDYVAVAKNPEIQEALAFLDNCFHEFRQGHQVELAQAIDALTIARWGRQCAFGTALYTAARERAGDVLPIIQELFGAKNNDELVRLASELHRTLQNHFPQFKPAAQPTTPASAATTPPAPQEGARVGGAALDQNINVLVNPAECSDNMINANINYLRQNGMSDAAIAKALDDLLEKNWKTMDVQRRILLSDRLCSLENTPRNLYYLSLAYEKAGDLRNALGGYRTVLTQNPSEEIERLARKGLDIVSAQLSVNATRAPASAPIADDDSTPPDGTQLPDADGASGPPTLMDLGMPMRVALNEGGGVATAGTLPPAGSVSSASANPEPAMPSVIVAGNESAPSIPFPFPSAISGIRGLFAKLFRLK